VGFVDREPITSEGGGRTGPEPRDDLDPVVDQCHPLSVGAGLTRERAELPPEVDPESDAEDQAATAEMVERGGFAGDLPRATSRASGVTSGPRRIADVEAAMALSATQASASGTGASYWM